MYTLDLIRLVQCQVNLVSANVANSLRSECRCQPNDLSRDASFSVGHVNSIELLIAELSHKRQAPFQSQRSKESAVWLFSLSPGAQCVAVRWTPAQSLSQQLFGEKKERARGVRSLWEQLNADLRAELQSFSFPESVATDTWDKDEEAEMLTHMACHRVSSVSGGGGGSICEREGSSNHQHRKCHFFKLIISMHR